MKEQDLFYCYSYRLYHFLSAFNLKYLSSKINKKSKCRYWTYKKSERLDRLIEQYNKIKNRFN